MILARQLLAFMRRDIQLELSYRFAVGLHVFGMLAHLLTFYYIGRLLPEQGSSWLSEYGVSYFPFVLVGIAFTGFLGFGLVGFSVALRNEQQYGTLEVLLASPTPAWHIAVLATFAGYGVTLLESVVYLGAGSIFLGVDFSHAAWLTAAVTLLLVVASFSALGVLAGSFILYFKRGDPVNWIMGTLSQFLGGVYFPVAVLPSWLGGLALLLPVTHGLHAMRLALFEGAGLGEVARPLLILLGFSVFGWPLALAALRAALDSARRRSNLNHY
ncbi:MAG: ABC transporter permease [Elusimicrobiota bacterium]